MTGNVYHYSRLYTILGIARFNKQGKASSMLGTVILSSGMTSECENTLGGHLVAMKRIQLYYTSLFCY